MPVKPDPEANKPYVEKYIRQAESTNSEEIKNNALYRAGTQMEVLESDGNMNLSSEQQKAVIDAAKELLGGK